VSPSTASSEPLPVVVVGAGMAGVSCARVLHEAGVAVRVVDRGGSVGGRMAIRTVEGPGGPRVVDVGASYLTARDPRFTAVVADWERRDLAHRWTDTFHLATPDGLAGTTTGPPRWAAPGGLRSLVEDLAAGLDVRTGTDVEAVWTRPDGTPEVDGEPAAAVVLAMPDPQAADLLPDQGLDGLLPGPAADHAHDWTPTICVWAAWDDAWWPAIDGAFVSDSALVSWVADDGRRRGDGAPVLVAHTPAVYAARHLEDPETVVGPVLDELGRVLTRSDRPLDVPEPRLTGAHRWSLAVPHAPRDERFHLGRGLVGVCGDGWGRRPRVEQAFLSGHELATALLERLRRA
jgi:renalase